MWFGVKHFPSCFLIHLSALKMKMTKKENTKTIMEFTKKDLQTNMIMNVIDIIYKKNIVNKILNYFNYI